MITPSFGLTATERVLPKLALDFTTAFLDSRVTFTRTTGASNPATYVASNGYITAATNNQPRFDYDPVTLACKGLLIEESRTNILYYSNDFSNAAWTATGATVSSESVTAPDGASTSWKVKEDSSTGVHRIEQQRTFATGTYTASVYAKAGERNWLQIRDGALGQGIWFNLSTGTVGTANNWTGSMQALGNGWYRCIGVRNFTVANAPVTVSIATADNTNTYAGVTDNGIYAFGYQLELGAFATSYIPTTTAALTRNADVATMTGTNFSDWYNATEGAFVAQTAFVGTAASRSVFYADDNTTNNYIGINTTSSSVGRGSIVQSGSPQASVSNGSAITAGATAKIGISYKTDNIYVSSNGAAASQDTSATIPTITQLQFSTFTGGSVTSQWLAKLNYYPQWLTSAEIRAFTK